MIGAGHVISFFIGAFVGRYLEQIIEVIGKIREDMQNFRQGAKR